MHVRSARSLAVLLACLTLPARTAAAPVTFTFQGEGTAQVAASLFGLSEADVVLFTGSFTVDDAAVVDEPGYKYYSCGSCATPSFTVTLSTADGSLLNGGAPLEWSDTFVEVASSGGMSRFGVQAWGTPLTVSGGLSFFLTYNADDVFPGFTLPPAILFGPELVGNSVRSSLSGQGGSVTVLGVLTDPNTTTVPEPTALFLLATALVATATAARRRRR